MEAIYGDLPPIIRIFCINISIVHILFVTFVMQIASSVNTESKKTYKLLTSLAAHIYYHKNKYSINSCTKLKVVFHIMLI